MGWELAPGSLTQMLIRLHQDYAPKAIWITENGAAYPDPEPVNGVVVDPERTDYLKTHIAAVETAIQQGSPVTAYFVWSLLDNFEWGYGYDRRFGIIHIDFKTLKRTMKQSALWYRDFIAKVVAD
jgi:beta-glucosidase